MRKFIPAPYEILAGVWVIAAYFIIRSLPVYLPIAETTRQAFRSNWVFLLVAFGTIAASSYVRQRWREKSSEISRTPLKDLLSTLIKFESWVAPLRISLAVVGTLVFHFLLKSSIYLIHPRVWDAQLMQLDRWIHFGISPSLFFVELFKSVYFYRAVDIFYTMIYGIIAVLYPPIFVGILPGRPRDVFATAFVLVFIVGALLYMAVPSWGPVFVESKEFEASLQYMPRTVRVQSQLYNETASLVRNPTGRRTIVYGGAAAFPSLHVAILTLFSLVSRGISRTWFKINVMIVLFMMLGSVVTGYHYLIDAYAGLLLGWGAYRISDLWVRRWMPGIARVKSPVL